LLLSLSQLLFAKVEIAIEGQTVGQKIFQLGDFPRLIGEQISLWGRSATGYHTWMSLFMLFSIHLVYLSTADFFC